MATEVLVTGQTAEGHVEEMNLADDVKIIDEESCSQSKDLEGKDKEKFEVDESASIEASAIVPEAAIISEEKQEDKSSESLAADIDKEAAKDEQTSDSLAEDVSVVEKEETPKLETEISATVEPTIEVDENELEDKTDSNNLPEPPKESIQESETVDDPEVKELAAAEGNASEEHTYAVSKAEEKITSEVLPEVSGAVSEPAVVEVAADEVNTAETVSEPAVVEVAAGEVNGTEPVSEPAVVEAAADEVNATEELTEPVSEPSVVEVAADEVNATEPVSEPAVVEVAADELNGTEQVSEPVVVEVTADEVNAPEELTEAVSEPTAPQVEAEEVNNTTGEIPDVTPVSEAQVKEAEPPSEPTIAEPEAEAMTTADVTETAEISQDEPVITDLRNVEAAVDVPETVATSETAEISQDEPVIADSSSEEVAVAVPETVAASETAEISQDEPVITDSSNIEVAAVVPETVAAENVEEVVTEAAPVAELKEVEEIPAIPKEVHTLRDIIEADKNNLVSGEESVISVDANPNVEPAEEIVKPEDKVEEGMMQEKTIVAEEPTLVDTAKVDSASEATEVLTEVSSNVEKVEEQTVEATVVPQGSSVDQTVEATVVPQGSSEGEKAPEGAEVDEEKKDGRLEAEKTSLNETSRDIDLQGAENNEKTEKDNEKAPVELAVKDVDEAPKEEVPVKSSQRQSTNIFSKVKQSIVKVKKAIIGKSPSSKTMTAEPKDEVKVK